MINENVGIVLEGGAMRSIFSAGVIDFLLEKPENIKFSKGYQFKFFMTYSNAMIYEEEYTSLKEEFELMNIITQVGNLFMQHHCISVEEIPLLFPLLSNDIIYKLLSNFHNDEDETEVKKEFLNELQKNCNSNPIPNRFTFVA